MSARKPKRPQPHVYFVKRRQESPLAMLLRGAEAVLFAGDYVTARAIYREVLAIDPSNRIAKTGLAEVRGLLRVECRRFDDVA